MSEPSTGICIHCRHPDWHGHCRGTGDLPGNQWWPGFICSCPCREES